MSGMYVLAASYDDVEAARADYNGIVAAHRHVGSTHDFDALVLARDEAGNVEVVERDDEQTRHKTGSGFGWGLAFGAAAALFPAVGIVGALAVGGGAGAALGRVAGHAARALTREDLKELGDVLDRGSAGLVVVYGPDIADRVATSATRATSKVQRSTSIAADQLAAELAAADRH
jgi:uncharacterized membrane protein